MRLAWLRRAPNYEPDTWPWYVRWAAIVEGAVRCHFLKRKLEKSGG